LEPHHRLLFQAGIREIADVPAGQSTDFIDLSLDPAADQAPPNAAYRASTADGYIDPFDEFVQQGQRPSSRTSNKAPAAPARRSRSSSARM
jgi:hypothetical protein